MVELPLVTKNQQALDSLLDGPFRLIKASTLEDVYSLLATELGVTLINAPAKVLRSNGCCEVQAQFRNEHWSGHVRQIYFSDFCSAASALEKC